MMYWGEMEGEKQDQIREGTKQDCGLSLSMGSAQRPGAQELHTERSCLR
jgi:hypothetical protein